MTGARITAMSADQPAQHQAQTRTSARRTRPARRARTTESEAAPLADLHRRCAAGAVASSIGYLAVLTTTAVRPTALNTPATVGLLVAFGTPAALCALGAVLTWAVARLPQVAGLQEIEYDRQAEDLKWAMRFGADMADAFHGTSPGSSGGR